jgi:predicted enzyme related to lactoylglutathione lyase
MVQHPRKDSAINRIEFNVADVERAKAFYGGAFGGPSPITARTIASLPTVM